MITLSLDPKELDYIVQVLTQRPWGEVNQLVQKIAQQVNQPKDPPAAS